MDEKLETQDLIDLIPLKSSTNEIAQKIISEDNIDNIQNLTHLFNLNQAKKNVLRIMKLEELLDGVSDQMISRIQNRAGEFSNSDLLNYMNVVQASIDRANKSLNLIDETPAIQLNQVNINVNEDDILSRESRDKVAEAIKAIMSKINKPEPVIEPLIETPVENTVSLSENEFNLIKGEEE